MTDTVKMEFPETLIFRVTAADIKGSKPTCAQECAMANAIRRTYEGRGLLRVTVSPTDVNHLGWFARTLWDGRYRLGNDKYYLSIVSYYCLSDAAIRWVRHHDSLFNTVSPSKPATFKLHHCEGPY